MVEATPHDRTESGYKIPLAWELPRPDERVFDNSAKAKPERKRKTLDVRFGRITNKNFE